MASRTLAQFRTIIASKIGLDNSVGGDQTLIDMWVNEGYEAICLETHARVLNASMALTLGTNDYTLDDDILAIVKLYNTAASVNYYMSRVTVDELVDMRAAVGSAPARYYAVSGANLLSVYPTPAAGEAVTIFYVPRPAALSVSSSVPTDLPAEYHKGIEYYALREAADYDDDQSSYLGVYYDKKYQEFLGTIRRQVNRMGGSKLPVGRLNRGRNWGAPHDRSTDLW